MASKSLYVPVHNIKILSLLILSVQSDKILALTNAAGAEIEPIWASLLAKALEGKDVKELLSNVGSGGGGPAVGAAGGASAAAGGGAAAAEEKEEEKKVEEKEESDDDMVSICSEKRSRHTTDPFGMITRASVCLIRLGPYYVFFFFLFHLNFAPSTCLLAASYSSVDSPGASTSAELNIISVISHHLSLISSHHEHRPVPLMLAENDLASTIRILLLVLEVSLATLVVGTVIASFRSA